MNILKTLVALVFVSNLISCNKSDDAKITFENDLEKITYWNDGSNNVQTVIRHNEAHSGRFVSMTDSVYQYSFMMKSKIGNLCEKKILKVSASAWVKITNLDAKANFVLSVDSAGTVLKWDGKEITPNILKVNEWTELKHELIFEDKFNNPNYIFAMYFWNTGKHEVLIDDFSLKILN